jgi:hypothetical protein
MAAGSRCSTCSTRLTDSTYWRQSSDEHSRRLLIALATETWFAAWCWCSCRIAASALVSCDARCSSTTVRIDDIRPYSRTRCRSWTTNVMSSTGGSGGGESAASPSVRDTYSSAARRAARDASVSAARRRRFSMSASFSMLGHAQSSPIVSGATR